MDTGDKFVTEFDGFLTSILDSNQLSDEMLAAVSYCTLGGGKRLRPRILVAIGEVLGVSRIDLMTCGAALELLHAASLVHDDLPALDNDDMRRGRPSLHRQFSEATAILAADLMQGLAFRIVAERVVGQAALPQVICSIAKTWQRVQEGQLLDIGRQKGAFDLVESTYRYKTAEMFAASFSLPGWLCRKAEELPALLYEAGIAFGIQFQLYDDKIDNTAEKGRGGTGSDQRNFGEEGTSSEIQAQLRSKWLPKIEDNLRRVENIVGVPLASLRGIIERYL